MQQYNYNIKLSEKRNTRIGFCATNQKIGAVYRGRMKSAEIFTGLNSELEVRIPKQQCT